MKKKIEELKNKLPLKMEFIIDEFEDGIYLVGVYEGGFASYLRKSAHNPTKEQKIKLQFDCLNEYFIKYPNN